MSTSLLSGLVPILAFAAGAGLVTASHRLFAARFGRYLKEQQAKIEERLHELFFEEVSARALVLGKVVGAPSAGLLCWLLSGSWVFAVLLAGALFAALDPILSLLAEKRRQRLSAQVLDLIQSLVATTKSGMSLPQSVEEIAQRMPAPMSQELSMVLERTRSGQTLGAALLACDERLGLPNLSLVLRSLVVHEERGGRLSDLLDKIAASLQAIERVEERVRTETAGIKLSSKIMAAMPLAVGFMLYLASPDHVTLLFTSLIGNLILVLAIVLDVIGFTLIKKLGDLEV